TDGSQETGKLTLPSLLGSPAGCSCWATAGGTNEAHTPKSSTMQMNVIRFMLVSLVVNRDFRFSFRDPHTIYASRHSGALFFLRLGPALGAWFRLSQPESRNCSPQRSHPVLSDTSPSPFGSGSISRLPRPQLSRRKRQPGDPVWSRYSTGLKRRGLQPRLVSSDCLLRRLDMAYNPASPYSIIALLVSGELRLPVFTPRLRHPACPPCKVRELPELRGSPVSMTSAIGCTEFSLGTVILGLIAVVVQRFLSAASQSAVAPGCEIPADARLYEMAREFLLSRSPQSFRNPASCRK